MKVPVISKCYLRRPETILCPVCASTSVKNVFKRYRKLNLVRCYRCRVIFQEKFNPVSYNEGLSKEYYLGQINSPYEKRVKFGIMAWLLEYKNSGNFLDIGCSIGILLDYAKRYFNIYGIDSSKFAINYCQNNIKGGKFYHGLIEHPHLPKNNFDVITLIEIFEHLAKPGYILSVTHELLKDDGILFITTGNINSLLRFIKGGKWHYFNSDHLVYYSFPAIRYLLESNGFKIIECTAPVKFKYMLRINSKYESKFLWLKEALAKFNLFGFTYNGLGLIAKKI